MISGRQGRPKFYRSGYYTSDQLRQFGFARVGEDCIVAGLPVTGMIDDLPDLAGKRVIAFRDIDPM